MPTIGRQIAIFIERGDRVLVLRHTNFAWWQAEGQRYGGEITCTNLSSAPLPPCRPPPSNFGLADY
ncbi:hypothetical protein LC609_31005 [Nostoc sp. XA013]|nr:hypothetical protein [Nostoc sp. XA013]